MKKHIICVFAMIGSFLLFVSGCSPNQGSDSTPAPVSVRNATGWHIYSKSTSEISVKKPAGLAVNGKDVFICDSDSNEIVQLSPDLTFENSWGSLGNEPGNFIQPTDILINGNKTYVLDAGNNRVQIFLHPDKVENTIPLFDYVPQNGDTYTHLAVTNSGELFVTTSALGDTDRVFLYNKDSREWDAVSDLYSCVTTQGDNVYAINTLEVTKKGKSVIAQSGSNSLYKYSSEHKCFEKQFEFPSMYTISDFVVTDDSIYVLSVYYKRLDRFDMTGMYQETIAEFDDADLFDLDTYLAIDDDGNFYVSDSRNGVLYKIVEET